MKLLLADDSIRFRQIMREYCIPLFSEIVECGDGLEAVIAYRTARPDWVIMDIKMPRMEGTEAARRIREEDGTARIVLVSQFNDEATVSSALSCGAVAFVQKDNLEEVVGLISSTP